VDHLPNVAADSVPGLIAVIDERDHFTARHSADVGRLCRLVAMDLGWAIEDVALAHVAGLVHDIGRVGLPDAVLTAPGRLSHAQWELMRAHPDRGADLLAALGVAAPIVDGVRAHHERWDGSGYPRGLCASDIPPLGRLIGLCESFDAMTARRPFGRAKPHVVAWSEVAHEAGILYDREMCHALLDVIGAGRPGEALSAGDFADEWRLARMQAQARSRATSATGESQRGGAIPRTPVDHS